MSTVTEPLPLTDTRAPADQAELAAVVAENYAQATPMYPIGGGTSLDYGLPATEPGLGISLANLNRTVDYPARDMTITVEAGVTIETLATTLAVQRQWLPVETASAGTASVGGLVATAWSGPRRYGYGTMRDYVIGMTAVDGRGATFHAGGRVVKNVAGYDFCKLVTGSLGTLGIITQVTLKIRPLPERSAFLACELRDFETAERLLAAIVDSATTPSAVDLLAGPRWRDHAGLGTMPAGCVGRLAVGLEGSAGEVEWMLATLADEWRDLGVDAPRILADEPAGQLGRDLVEFSAEGDAPLVLKAGLLPSRTVGYVRLVLDIDPEASIAAHAGNGIVIARFSKFDAADVSRQLVGRLQPAAQAAGGGAVVVSGTVGGWTRQAVWGNATAATRWMGKVKRQFDPKNLLNPGRFVYDFS